MITEYFLQYAWHFRLISNENLRTVTGEKLEIISTGKWNHNAGPDFLLAQIKINELIFVGDVEIHIKTSDWLRHGHSQDPAYETTILHVVYEKDTDIPCLTKANIPELVIKNYLPEDSIRKFYHITASLRELPCEGSLHPEYLDSIFYQKKFFEKLAKKSERITKESLTNKGDIEAIFFLEMAYAFGLSVNAEIFRQIAESIDFQVIKKLIKSPNALEIYFMGICGWLDGDLQETELQSFKKEYTYLKQKFNFPDIRIFPKFSKLRPPNFPGIRLSQLATLYETHSSLFSTMMEVKGIRDCVTILSQIRASTYWVSRFTAGKLSKSQSPKVLSESFIERIVINAILPMRYHFYKDFEVNIYDDLWSFISTIRPESNGIIDIWNRQGINPTHAGESQALIYHYKIFCQNKKCLHCEVGLKIFKNNEHF